MVYTCQTLRDDTELGSGGGTERPVSSDSLSPIRPAAAEEGAGGDQTNYVCVTVSFQRLVKPSRLTVSSKYTNLIVYIHICIYRYICIDIHVSIYMYRYTCIDIHYVEGK